MRAAQMFGLVLLAACSDSGGVGPSGEATSTMVEVSPDFYEAFAPSYPGETEFTLEGQRMIDWEVVGRSAPNQSALVEPGSTVELVAHSLYYDPIDTTFTVPDTVTADPQRGGRRAYTPRIPMDRLGPAVTALRWSADYTGPAIDLDLYAPRGFNTVRVFATYVFLKACSRSDPSCLDYSFIASAGPGWQADSSRTELSGWIQLTGTWQLWPQGPPPPGYGSGYWSARLDFALEDDQGIVGNWSCQGVRVIGNGQAVYCRLLSIRHS
jgi:hypothetical protein